MRVALTSGEHRPGPPVRSLFVAEGICRRFARAYARVAYLRRPPRLALASRSVNAAIAATGPRVPAGRRALRAHLHRLRVLPLARDSVQASAWLADGHSAPFSITFTLSRRGGAWRVTSISLPG